MATAPPPRIAALILAAGRSSRMGRSKTLIPIDGKPMIARIVDAALASQASPVVVVTGHDAAAVRAALRPRPVVIVDNPAYQDGLSTSLAAGVRALPEMIDGVAVCLGDMPALSPQVIDALIAAFDPHAGRSIVVPMWRARRGHPVLWGRQFFAALTALAGDAGGRGLLAENADAAAVVVVDDDSIVTDIDTPEALAQYLDRTGLRKEVP